MSNCVICQKVLIMLLFSVCFSFNHFRDNKHGSYYSENRKWKEDNLSYYHKSENEGRQEEDDSHYYGEKSKLTHASQTFYNKSKISNDSDENFGDMENLPHNHILVNVVHDIGNDLNDHNSDLSQIKDGNESDKVGPRLGPHLDNKKGQANINDLAISTMNYLEASNQEITTLYIEKYKNSSTGQDNVGPSSGPPFNDAQDQTKIFDHVTTTDSFETKDQEITVSVQENYESQQNVESNLGPTINKKVVQTMQTECFTITDRLLLTTSLSTRDYKDHSTEQNYQTIQMYNNNAMEADSTIQEDQTSTSTANIVSTMKSSDEVSDKIITSSSDVAVKEAFELNTEHARDQYDTSPYRTTMLIGKEKRHKILEKESDRGTTIYSTKFDFSEEPNESTEVTIKGIENAESDQLDPSSIKSGPSPPVGKPQTIIASTVNPLRICTCQIAKEKKRHFGTQTKLKYNKEGSDSIKVGIVAIEIPRHSLEEVYRSNEKNLLQTSWKVLIFVCMLLEIVV